MTLLQRELKERYVIINNTPTKVSSVYIGNGDNTATKIRPTGWRPCTITGSALLNSYSPTYSDLQGCYISPDGTHMYIPFWSDKRTHQYTLSTPWDVSTATHINSISTPTPGGIFFSDDGTHMYIGNESGPYIQRYTLSTPRDIITASLDQSLTLSGGFTFTVMITEDGKNLYCGGNSSSTSYWYKMSTARDLTTATLQASANFGTNTNCIAVRNDGKYFYLANADSGVTQYELSIPYDISSQKTQIGTMTFTGYNDGRALFVSEDCKYWTFGIGTAGVTINLYQSVKL